VLYTYNTMLYSFANTRVITIIDRAGDNNALQK